MRGAHENIVACQSRCGSGCCAAQRPIDQPCANFWVPALRKGKEGLVAMPLQSFERKKRLPSSQEGEERARKCRCALFAQRKHHCATERGVGQMPAVPTSASSLPNGRRGVVHNGNQCEHSLTVKEALQERCTAGLVQLNQSCGENIAALRCERAI
eukprot:SAG11_NODE_1865_length_4153_cov_8.490133_1_plen_156_part_00